MSTRCRMLCTSVKEQLPTCHEDGTSAAFDCCIARRLLHDPSQALKISSSVTLSHGIKDLAYWLYLSVW